MEFIELLKKAQEGDNISTEQLIDLYVPLLKHTAIVGQKFDEDLFQELCCTMLLCIRKYKLSIK